MLMATNGETSVSKIAHTDERIDEKEFRRLVALTFLFFFFIAAFSRLLPRAWRPFASSAARAESVFAEAKRAAHTVIPFAFMR